jgi:hypothetical protein
MDFLLIFKSFFVEITKILQKPRDFWFTDFVLKIF